MPKLKKESIVRLENEINNFWAELNTANIPHNVRMAMEKQMQEIEEEFKQILNGQKGNNKLEKKLNKLDLELANAAICQAENEISKAAHGSASYQGLEHVKQNLKEKAITPSEARHSVKTIVRNH